MTESRKALIAALKIWAVVCALAGLLARSMRHSKCRCQCAQHDFEGMHGPCIYCGNPVFCKEAFYELCVLEPQPAQN